MRMHVFQTGTVAIKQRQVHGVGAGMQRRLNTLLDHTWTDPLPIYAWVIEHPEGIIVVDTGETARATEPGYFPWWHPYYRLGVREWVRPEEEVGPQLRTLGIPPEEVRWVVLTHLHSDHAGGLAHFPKADILLSRTEYQSAAGWRGQVRGYLPQQWPTWFAPPQPDWPPQTQLTSFVFYDKQNGHESISERLEEFLSAGSAPIIFTPGTAMKHANQFFADCMKACQMLGRRGILLTQHPDQLPRELQMDFQHFAYLPFSKILPRAVALVHHGGIGTTAQAIAARIPQVIRPMAHDQPDNAARVERLGIGTSLSPPKFNAASLAEKLNTVITAERVLDRCKSFARKIKPDQSLDDTCTIIEDFARKQS